ncbi:hypothetical protein BACCIP111883_03093 [Sutcliffiella rhizosphaerae]|uniref:Uncharacterized protein n=1 Tax=Sutcliffiella rhizosphaerae TaxID=2880967 RepID=A0ABM8YQU4_9BACI|nr:hypothetical protein BACCIP111883_03093 [Sutcliffiella rhizosphaerae]
MENNIEIQVSGTITLEDFKQHNTYHIERFIKISYFVLFFIFFALFSSLLFLIEDFLINFILFIVNTIVALILSSLLILYT